MRLSIDCRMWNSGGIGTYLRNLVPELITLLPNYKLFLLGNNQNLKTLEIENKNVEIIECNSPIYSILEQYELFRKIPKCDIFFSPQYNIPLLYRGIQVTTIHDIFHIADENKDQSFIKNIYAKTMLSVAMRKSKIVFSDSNYTLSEMKKYNLPCLEKVKIIYLSHNLENNKFIKNNIEKKNSHILFVGNIKPHKNLRRLVEAYKILNTKYKISLQLIIVGDSENFISGIPGFKEEITNSYWNKMVKFTGKISDEELIEYYQNATLLVLPSLYEGFGLPPLEAMACGCPVVVSNAASLTEICDDAALYCDPYNIEDIAKKMNEIIVDSELRDRLIEKGFKQVKKFNWRKTATTFVETLEEVLN